MQSKADQPTAVTPQRVMEMIQGFWVARTLVAGVELKIFTHVAQGRDTLPALLEASGASRRGLPMLLDALVALGLLSREGDGDAARYGLPLDAAAFLVEGRESYLGDFLILNAERIDHGWTRLAEVVHSGKSVEALDRPEEGVPFWRRLVGSLFPLGYPAARAMGEELRRLYPEGEIRLLDVAAGSGVWGIGAAEGDRRMRVTAMDLPETLEVTREFIARHGLEAQFDYLPGDLRAVDFPIGRFDAAVLGQICHSEGVEGTRRLLGRMARVLKPGGTLIIADRFPDPDRCGPVPPLLFALNMLVLTSEGNVWSIPEFTAWLEDAGFRDVRPLRTPGPEPLLIATRWA